jgi:glutathione S-transferase
MKLYHFPLSGHAHRAHLLLSLLGLDYELVEVDLPGGAQRSPDFLKLNPFGQVPVLDDDGTVIADSTAILVYLAKKYQRRDWLPEDAVGAAQVQRWLSIASGEVFRGPCAARLVTLFGYPFDHETAVRTAHAFLKKLDAELADRDWLVSDHPTIADVAIYSYVARAPEGGVDLAAYHQVNAWLARIEALPGFVPFVQTVTA